jgi:hypothetical protein
MKGIQNYSQSIGHGDPTITGRLKRVIGSEQARAKKLHYWAILLYIMNIGCKERTHMRTKHML